jgi:hypothetical protein
MPGTAGRGFHDFREPLGEYLRDLRNDFFGCVFTTHVAKRSIPLVAIEDHVTPHYSHHYP